MKLTAYSGALETASLGPSEILAMMAVVVGFLFWRLEKVSALLDVNESLNTFIRAGYQHRWVRGARIYCAVEGLLRFAGIAACFILLLDCYSYFELVSRMASSMRTADISILALMSELAIALKNRIVALSFIALILTATDWMTAEIRRVWMKRRRIEEAKPPHLTHPHAIPSEWVNLPVAMWEERLSAAQHLAPIDQTSRERIAEAARTGDWLRNWPTWSCCVGAYQLACANMAQPAQESGLRPRPTGASDEAKP